MESFLDSHRSSDWYDQVNSVNYQTLRSLNGDSDDGISCLKPTCKSQDKIKEKRKAETVQAIVMHVNAGGDIADFVPGVCNCQDLTQCCIENTGS